MPSPFCASEQTAQSDLDSQDGEKSVLLPLVEEMVPIVDPKSKMLYVNPPDGLFQLAESPSALKFLKQVITQLDRCCFTSF